MAPKTSVMRPESSFASSFGDETGQPNLIINSSQNRDLIWTLINNQEDDLVVTPFDSSKVDDSQFHFKFHFGPAVLTDTPTVQGWNVFPVKDNDGGIESLYIALSGSNPLTIKSGLSLKTTFTYTHAVQKDATRPTVDISITTGSKVTLGNDPIEETIGPFDLTLIHDNTPTLSVSPLAVDFVGRRTLLNDGRSCNSFTFALTNMTRADLSLTPEATDEVTASPTSFLVWFDAAPDTANHGYAWALAKSQHLASKFFDLTGPEGWKCAKITLEVKDIVVSPHWAITVEKPVVLKPQDPVLFTFKDLKTDLDPGVTRMYLRFQNLPDFSPGVLIAELEKSPMVYGVNYGQGLYLSTGTPTDTTAPPRDYDSALFVHQFGNGAAAIFNGGKVGIETSQPGSSLSVNGGVAIGKDYAQNTTAVADSNLAVQGKVGIGTAQPGSSLSVGGGVAIGRDYAKDTTAVADNNLAVQGKVGIGTTQPGSSLSVGGGVAIGRDYAQNTTPVPDNNLAVQGKVGIGTTTPRATLQIGNPSIKQNIFSDPTTVGIVQDAGDSVGLSVHRVDGNPVLQFCAYDQTGSHKSNYIQLEKGTGDIMIGRNDYTRLSQGGYTRLTQFGHMWTNNLLLRGKVEFGVVDPNDRNMNAGGYIQHGLNRLEIYGATKTDGSREVHLWDNVFVHGKLWTNGGKEYSHKLDLESPSDARLKKNVTPIESPLDKVRKVNGCHYDWTDEALTLFTKDIDTIQPADSDLTAEQIEALKQAEREKQFKILGRPQVGVIAQEVEAVLPEAVTTGEDGYKSVSFHELIALLIEAVKEQDRTVTAQAALLTRQQTEIEKLKQALLTAAPQFAY